MTTNPAMVRFAKEVHGLLKRSGALDLSGPGPKAHELAARMESGFEREAEVLPASWLGLRDDARMNLGGISTLGLHVCKTLAWLCEGMANAQNDEADIVTSGILDEFILAIRMTARKRYEAVSAELDGGFALAIDEAALAVIEAAAERKAMRHLAGVAVRLIMERDSAE